MHKLFYIALGTAFFATMCLSVPAEAAGTGPEGAGQTIKAGPTAKPGATTKQAKARGAKVRRAVMRARSAKPGVRRTDVKEQDKTRDLNRHSLQDSQRSASRTPAAPTQEEPPLNHRLPQSLERFANANKITKQGWTSSFGLLPQPESKLSLPSPDVRLQERAIHLGAAYHF
jgi:hypothetical protein